MRISERTWAAVYSGSGSSSASRPWACAAAFSLAWRSLSTSNGDSPSAKLSGITFHFSNARLTSSPTPAPAAKASEGGEATSAPGIVGRSTIVWTSTPAPAIIHGSGAGMMNSSASIRLAARRAESVKR